MREYRFALVAVAAIAMVTCGSVQGGAFSDGSIFTETFTGNVVDNPDSADPHSRVQDDPGATDISVANERLEWTAGFDALGNPGNGEYFADRFLNGTLGANDSYAVEATWVVNALSGCCTDPPLFRSNLLRPLSPVDQSNHTDIRLMAVQTAGDPTTWDIRVHEAGSAGSATDGGEDQGLALVFGQEYQIMSHHKGNAAGDIDLYIDGGLVGSFTDRLPLLDTEVFQLGNGTNEAGFDQVSWMDNFKIGNFVPEPASMMLLGLGGLLALRRRS